MKNGWNWRIVQKVSHRHVYDVPEMESDDSTDPVYDDDPFQLDEGIDIAPVESDDGDIQLLSLPDEAPITLSQVQILHMENLLQRDNLIPPALDLDVSGDSEEEMEEEDEEEDEDDEGNEAEDDMEEDEDEEGKEAEDDMEDDN
ncbi:unnamed protein product [Linum trigynum]|uniref:Uncharacterized protein n=1 Tax=Linum trigynum TaxID=586398 RepID=A0AAV2E9D9_9ROSI